MVSDGPEELRQVAEKVVGEAALFVRARRQELLESPGGPSVRSKSSPTDPVTAADTETEALVRAHLARVRPGDPVLGEERGGAANAGDAVRWVVDPIDGTVNFLYGIPAYAVSLAAQIGAVSVAGAVADICSGEVYSAAAGGGAWLRAEGTRRRLCCTGVTDLSMALVGTGFGYQPQRRAAQAAVLAGLLPVVRDIRRFGSAALDLCQVAAGRLDAHYEHGLKVWDWAAGALIAAEAGAQVTLPDDAAPDDAAPNDAAGLLVASAPGIAAELMAVLQRLNDPKD